MKETIKEISNIQSKMLSKLNQLEKSLNFFSDLEALQYKRGSSIPKDWEAYSEYEKLKSKLYLMFDYADRLEVLIEKLKKETHID
jgi:hypothetical protein